LRFGNKSAYGHDDAAAASPLTSYETTAASPRLENDTGHSSGAWPSTYSRRLGQAADPISIIVGVVNDDCGPFAWTSLQQQQHVRHEQATVMVMAAAAAAFFATTTADGGAIDNIGRHGLVVCCAFAVSVWLSSFAFSPSWPRALISRQQHCAACKTTEGRQKSGWKDTIDRSIRLLYCTSQSQE
jgi:fermentation-respiration switch protein FrsA (DUF1100 family)